MVEARGRHPSQLLAFLTLVWLVRSEPENFGPFFTAVSNPAGYRCTIQLGQCARGRRLPLYFGQSQSGRKSKPFREQQRWGQPTGSRPSTLLENAGLGKQEGPGRKAAPSIQAGSPTRAQKSMGLCSAMQGHVGPRRPKEARGTGRSFAQWSHCWQGQAPGAFAHHPRDSGRGQEAVRALVTQAQLQWS